MKLSALFSWQEGLVARFVQVVLVITIGLLVISAVNFWQAVRPPKITIPGTPEDYGLVAEDISITAPDGTNLQGWYIPAEDKEETTSLILLHGYPAEKADMLSIAEKLHPHFSLLLLDLRYFGESEGKATTLGVKEPDDVQQAVQFLKEKGYEDIGIFGFSFGGAVALMTAAQEPDITAVGSYASYADLRQLGYDVFSILPGVKYPLVELINLWSGVFFGDFSASASPLEAAQELEIPVLLVHSKQDEQIPFTHAQKLQKALQDNKKAEFYFIEEGRHGGLSKEFYDRLIEFFGE